MAVQDRTTVFEMRRRAQVDFADHLITSASVEQFPERDIDELRAALRTAETIDEAAAELGCPPSEVRRWASIYTLAHEIPSEQEDRA